MLFRSDGAIETLSKANRTVTGVEVGLPIGFAMARLKLETQPTIAGWFLPGLPIGFAMARLKLQSWRPSTTG